MWLLIFPLFLLLRTSQAYLCSPAFFAKYVPPAEALLFDYYYTAMNVTSAWECAAFCSERRFCRSALFDKAAKACAISYEQSENCRKETARYHQFKSPKGTGSLLIACIDKCKEHREYDVRRTPHRVDIITGEPHDAIPEKNKSKPVHRREQSFLWTSLNSLGRRDPPKLILGEPHDGNGSTVTASNSIDGYVNRLVLTNLSMANPNIRRSDPAKRPFSDSPICFRTKRNRYLMGGSFKHIPHTSLENCRCQCANAWRDNNRCESLNYYANGMCVLNTGSHRGRFDLIDDPASTYQYVGCDVSMLIGMSEIVCDLKKGTESPATHVFSKVWKQSKETSTTEESSTESDEDDGERDTVPVTTTSSSTVSPKTTTTARSEEKEDELDALRRKLKEVEREIQEEEMKERELREKEERLERESEEQKANNKRSRSLRSGQVEEKDSEETKKSGEKKERERTTTEEPKKGDEKSGEKGEKEEKTKSKETEERDDGSSEETATVSSTTATTTKATTTTEKPKKKKSEKEIDGKKPVSKGKPCYEELFDYVMTSTAGGLEHDVSMDECKCLCANSMTSGRYAFQCRSATYYHNERDCVLNVESRRQRPELLERHFRKTYNVTYLGLQCGIMQAVMELVNPRLEAGCIQPYATTKNPTTTTTTERTTTTAKRTATGTDGCFLELPHFVLEGTAQAVETDVSVEECKCSCAAAETKYGEPCQSAQYFPEERICLLNKKNRFSNPEAFNYVPLSPQSYYESKCTSRQEERDGYLSKQCAAFTKDEERKKLRRDESPEKIEPPEDLVEGKKIRPKTQDDLPQHKKEKKHAKERKEEKKILVDRETDPVSTTTTTTTTSTTPSTTPSTTTVTTTTTRPSTTTSSTTKSTTTVKTTTKRRTTMTTKPPTTRRANRGFQDTVRINYAIPEAEGFDSRELEQFLMEEHMMSAKVLDDQIAIPAKASQESLDDNSLGNDNEDSGMESDNFGGSSEEESGERREMEEEEDVMEEELMFRDYPKHEPSTRPPSTPVDTTTVAPTTVSTTTVPSTTPTTTTPTTTTASTTTTTTSPTTTTTVPTTVSTTTEPSTTVTTASSTTESTTEPTTTAVRVTVPTLTTTTSERPRTTKAATEYPPAGPCTYSAIYQTAFRGNKLLKTVDVKSPSECFSACYALGCRSANLFAAGSCELYKDALIDYRRPDVVGYEHGAVYFDGISCQGPPTSLPPPIVV